MEYTVFRFMCSIAWNETEANWHHSTYSGRWMYEYGMYICYIRASMRSIVEVNMWKKAWVLLGWLLYKTAWSRSKVIKTTYIDLLRLCNNIKFIDPFYKIKDSLCGCCWAMCECANEKLYIWIYLYVCGIYGDGAGWIYQPKAFTHTYVHI